MSERTAQIVETASIVVIGLAILFWGRVLIANLAHFPAVATIALVVIGLLQTARIRRDLAGGEPAGRLRATRDVAFVAATLFALVSVFAPVRWAVGACLAATEFAIVLELLARFSPAPAPTGAKT